MTISYRNCEHCGSEYKPHDAESRFCSRSCAGKHIHAGRAKTLVENRWRDKVRSRDMSCVICQKLVRVKPNQFDSFKCCSRACLSVYNNRVNRVDKSCLVCGDKFSVTRHRETTAKYCSTKCYHKAQYRANKVYQTCRHCGKNFWSNPSDNRVYCSVGCTNKDSKDRWNPSFSTVRGMMLVRGMIQQCERCGYDDVPEILGVHHKDENRHNNQLSNLAVLCPNCHSLAHRKHIPHGQSGR